MAGVSGFSAFMGIDTVNPITVAFDFQSEQLVCEEEFLDTNGVRGTRSRAVERNRQGNRRIHGPIELQPTTVELSNLLAWCLGGTPSGSPTVTYPLGDTLSTRYVTVDRVAKVFTYNGVAVDNLTITGSQGQPMKFHLDCVGQDETVANAGTFPAGLVLDITTQPFIFTDLVLSVAGTSYNAKEVSIGISNVIDKERFFNSQTLVSAIAHDRHITVSTSLPYGDAVAVYGASTIAGGVAVVATFTNGTSVLTLTFVKVAFPRHSPHVPGRVEIMLPLTGKALKSGTTLELVTTLHN